MAHPRKTLVACNDEQNVPTLTDALSTLITDGVVIGIY